MLTQAARMRALAHMHHSITVIVYQDETGDLIASVRQGGNELMRTAPRQHMDELLLLLDLALNIRAPMVGRDRARTDERYDVALQLPGRANELPWLVEQEIGVRT